MLAPSAPSAAASGPVGVLSSPVASEAADGGGPTLYRVVVADQRVAVTAAHEAPTASRAPSRASAASVPVTVPPATVSPARPASPASATPARPVASARSSSSSRRSSTRSAPDASARPAASDGAGEPPARARSASPARGASPRARGASPRARGASQARGAADRPIAEPASGSAPTAPARAPSGSGGGEVWSAGEHLTWVALSERDTKDSRASLRSGRSRTSEAGRGRGIPTGLKVAVLIAVVLLVLLVGLVWLAPMLLGPDFSLSHIVGSLLGQGPTTSAIPVGGAPV